MTHRSDTEALRARLEEKEHELRSAKDELEAADQLLWDARKSTEPVPRGESGPVKGVLVIAGMVSVALVAGTLGMFLGQRLRPSSTPFDSSLSFEAVVAQAGSTPGLEAGDHCTVTLDVTRTGVLHRTEIDCGATSIDVPRRDVADASDREVTLDLAHGLLEIRRAREDDVLALRLGDPTP